MPRIVYSRRYNIGLFGLERLHPFDSRKYGRAWRALRRRFGWQLRRMRVRPPGPATRRQLEAVHAPAYLDALGDSRYLAKALEAPIVARLPAWLVDWCVLRPMRWATMGTIVAARESLRHGFAVNLGGGFHHAKPAAGEGFCIYSDIALAIHTLREEGALDSRQRVAYVDLDAHQGNGVCHAFLEDDRVFIFDMYNATAYPWYDVPAHQRIDCDVPLGRGCPEKEYLAKLKEKLPGFLDSVGRSQPVGLAVYNAGTDVYTDDPLGGLSLSAEGILQRDLFVVEQLRQRGLPTVMLLAGGYTGDSYKLVAESVARLIDRCLKTS